MVALCHQTEQTVLDLCQQIAAITPSADGYHLLHLPTVNRIVDDGNYEIDRGTNRALLRCVRSFTYQILQTHQRLRRTVRVNRRYTAWVPGVPGFEQRQGRGAV